MRKEFQIQPVPREQCEPQPKLIVEETLVHSKKSRPSLLYRASNKSLEGEDQKDARYILSPTLFRIAIYSARGLRG